MISNLLIDAGAKMQKDNYGLTPLLIAALNDHKKVMLFFFKFSSLNEQRDAWKLLGKIYIFL